ncbi:hypothetical protein A2996_01100 [Candidatus Campbellbacteria bacterium RIFCSPLOWO2_01_FULL_34_15]|uniref:Phospholipase C/D domain-containing protein n=2 Tax=Candidatus Campbelliibacteriota TaxID=1752727 RepID=A0A1F5ELK7_9BACT|nr:MAG: hypothetical protein A2996_01100 [Candidatus Campbellbacteria bacterium RIFCSPLOWO2_01_FULL_34_15]OGD69218.1 MAG: hypothetical protein A2811_02720 [Candidatus Campbellbacteria bacterium RIFCSPHIGHO2_01_FULL_34_10]
MKENTHLYFAEKVFDCLENKNLRKILKENFDYYVLGSVFPDIFYHNKKTSEISQIIHGRELEKTNELIFDFLNYAKEKQDEKSLAFTLGYISHYVLDSKLHPIVYFLTGNYYDKDQTKRFSAMLYHRQLETLWDKKLTKGFSLCKKVKISSLNDLSLTNIIFEKYEINKKTFISIFKQCKINNRLFRSYMTYLLFIFLIKVGLYKNKTVDGFFLFTKNKNLENISNDLSYRDLITGEHKKENLLDLMKKTELYSKDLLESAYEYYLGKISILELERTIPGVSLDTGKIDFSVESIVYTKY